MRTHQLLPWHIYRVPMLPCLRWLIMGKEIFDSSQRQYSPLCKFRFYHDHSRMIVDSMLCPRTQCIFLWNALKSITGLRHLSSIRGCKQALKRNKWKFNEIIFFSFRTQKFNSKSVLYKLRISPFTCAILKHLLKVFDILFVS